MDAPAPQLLSFGLLLLLALHVGTAVAQAEPHERAAAATLFNHGVMHYAQGDYEQALQEFTRAHELIPNYRVLFNIAQVQFQLGQHIEAHQTLNRYLQQGGDQIAQARREKVDADLEALKQHFGMLRLSAEPAGATVTIDDLSITDTSQPLAMTGGAHHVAVSLQGYVADERTIEIAPGRTLDVTITLQPSLLPPARVAAPVAPPPTLVVQRLPAAAAMDSGPRQETDNVPWLAWAITGGFGVGALTFGLLAVNAKSSFDSARKRSTTKAELEGEYDAVLGLSLAADVFLAGTLLAGGISTYLTLASDDEVELAATPGGVVLRTTFE